MFSCLHASESGEKCAIEAGAGVNGTGAGVNGDVSGAGAGMDGEGAGVNGFIVQTLSEDETILISACELGHHKCVEALIEAGADLNKHGASKKPKTTRERTPLYVAAQRGFNKCLDLLIKAGADVNEGQNDTILQGITFKMSRTPLVIAAERGHDKCVDLLIKAGADVNIVCGVTALECASRKGNVKCIELLLEAHKNYKPRNDTGGETYTEDLGSCSSYSSKSDSDDDSFEFIYQYPEISAETSALIRAAQFHYNCESLDVLVDAGTDVNGTDRVTGASSLMHVAGRGCEQCVNKLLAAGADVNALDADIKTALMYAAREGKANCVDILLAAGAEVNVISGEEEDEINSDGKYVVGETALSIATDFQATGMIYKTNPDADRLRAFKIILKAGANVNTLNWENKTILDRQLSESSTPQFSKPENQEVIMLLFAAGCQFDSSIIGEDLPEFLEELIRPVSTLKDLSRRTLRKLLIETDAKNVNLFKKIPVFSEAIGLPSLLQSYLLYNMKLED